MLILTNTVWQRKYSLLLLGERRFAPLVNWPTFLRGALVSCFLLSRYKYRRNISLKLTCFSRTSWFQKNTELILLNHGRRVACRWCNIALLVIKKLLDYCDSYIYKIVYWIFFHKINIWISPPLSISLLIFNWKISFIKYTFPHT